MNSIKKLNQEEEQSVDEILDPFSFEKYCGACDNFQTENCPFVGKVFVDTEYKKELNCEKFWD